MTGLAILAAVALRAVTADEDRGEVAEEVAHPVGGESVAPGTYDERGEPALPR